MDILSNKLKAIIARIEHWLCHNIDLSSKRHVLITRRGQCPLKHCQ